MAATRYIFLASIGNPSPYTNTFHSAGHILLDSLATHLSLPHFSTNPNLRPGPSTTTSITTSQTTNLTLWQSPVQMNISGPPLMKVWKAYLSNLAPDERASAELFIAHDELEAKLGAVKVRKGTSVRGHNGLKSVIKTFGGRADGFSRIGIGIGRPESRSPEDVSRYVLRKCSMGELDVIRGAAGEVARILGVE